jgi:hypothetical protein
MGDEDLSQQYSTFVQNYNQNMACDAECQQQKELTQLKQNYYNALNNLDTAPEQVQSAYQAYITFAEGTGAYQKYQQGSIQQDAINITTQYQLNFDYELNNAQKLLSTYTTLYTNYSNSVELNNIYQNENAELQTFVDNTSSDTLTNDRKTYYETQAVDSLQKYYWILSIVYTIIVIYYIISVLTKQSEYKVSLKIIVLILLIIYPFISLWLTLKIIYMYNYIINLFPKNQYKTL